MDIVLHLGAHRTGTTTFQFFLRQQQRRLTRNGVEFWSPRMTRNGMFETLMPGQPRQSRREDLRAGAIDQVQTQLELAERRGVRVLVISEENFIGSMRANYRARSHYPTVGEHLARCAEALGRRVRRAALAVCAPESYWASALSYTIRRGWSVPTAEQMARIAGSPRSWRGVITDIAKALPETEIQVVPFEKWRADPEVMATRAIGHDLAFAPASGWRNRSPDLKDLRKLLDDRGEDASGLPDGDGVYQPFTPAQIAGFRAQYREDLDWLARGADGLANLVDAAAPAGRRQAPDLAETRGQDDDYQGNS